MNYTTILNKAKGLVLWIYKNITNKFTVIFNKLKEWFPILDRFPLLKYSLIPVLVGLFILLRYIIKLVLNELAEWTSGFVGETSGYIISEGTIILGIAALFIILRIVLKFRSQKNSKSSELEMNDENTK